MGLFFTLLSCTDPHSFRIKGQIEHLAQADFYIYSPDGAIQNLDTIHVVEGQFDWHTTLTEEATFIIIYPNYSEQVIFAQPGQVIKIKGDAQQLRDITVTGSQENEMYTQFRLQHKNDTQQQIKNATQQLIDNNPGNRVAIFLKRKITIQDARQSRIQIGDKLPMFSLPPDKFNTHADTITPNQKPMLIIFWATWSGQSHNFNTHARQIARNNNTSTNPQIISISLDTDTRTYNDFIRRDTVTWIARCYQQAWSTPLVEQLGLTNIPYAILTDANRNILAAGSDWEKDIQPIVEKFYKK